MTRTLWIVGMSMVALCCTSKRDYARRPPAERSAQVFAGAVRPGMVLQDVVRAMIESRLPGQYVSLSSKAPNGDTVRLILHADEVLATFRDTQVLAAGFASIEQYHAQDTRLQSYGFERQGLFLAYVERCQQGLLAQPNFVAAFDGTVEGGCGESTITVDFDGSGRVSSIGQVAVGACGRE
jgi:hypothetical protein